MSDVVDLGHELHLGQAVWLQERHKERGKQPNGEIVRIDWRNHIAYVLFYDTPCEVKGVPFDTLDGNYEPCFGGTWMIYSY